MAERRKIIIPIRANPDEPLSAPHFDAEATQTAQRVVPLSDEEAKLLRYGNYPVYARKPFWKRPAVVALVVLIAAGLGVAAGFAIGMYRNHKTAQTPVVNAQASPAESTNQIAEQPAPTPTPMPRASVPEKPSETPAAESKTEDRSPAARDEQKNSNDEAVPPAVSDKKRTQKDENDNIGLDEKQTERERRREARRAERRREQDEENPVDAPRQIDRARRQIDRIRDIFEGRQP